MQHDFWLARWRDNLIGFHKSEINPVLVNHVDQLQLSPGDQVFVPLCGKSLDMDWLQRQGYRVLGVELSSIAANDFFREHNREVSVSRVGDFESYRGGDIEILCGDYFALTPEMLADVKAVYDRASLIAMPEDMRRDYATRMAELLPSGTRVLLVTLDYPQGEMNGPPFSVPADMVQDLYGERFSINLLDTRDVLVSEPRFKEQGLTRLDETIYLLQRK